MYYYQDIVDHLRQVHPKESAKIFDQIFLSLLTDHCLCDVFIEAGAFDAQTSTTIKSKNTNCRVFAFEANIDNYNHFKKNLKDINYEFLAISDRCGKIIFKQQSHTTDGAVFPKIRGNNSLKTRTLDKNTVYNDIEVPCTTLDDFFKNILKPQDSVAIWLDLEGAAFEALTASKNTLSQTTFLKVEVEDKHYWQDQKLSKDIIDLLSYHDMMPLLRDFE